MRSESVSNKLNIFHSTFKHPVDIDYPSPSTTVDKTLTLRRKLIEEEYNEVIHAIETKKANKVLKELCDLVYVCVGMATTYGWDFDTAFNRVHASNMSKLDDEGNPVYNKDGKVIKSKNYVPPKINDLV